MAKWKCIKSFSVTVCDEDGDIVEDENGDIIEDNEQQVELGSEWIQDEDNVPSLSEFRLENDSDWLEVSEETFENCFEKLGREFLRWKK